MSRPGPDAVAEFMRTHVAPGERVIAAVSGGPDSMAMLDLLLRARAACGYELEVAHIHHHLRAASDEEWRFVEEYCQARGVRFHGRHVQVREKAQGRSLESAAHTLRHAALAKILQERQAQWLALAHQADDRAETVLMNILRGTSVQGLAAMPARDGNILRPLLSFTKAELEAYCAAQDIPYVVDESNADTTILRNRLRHKLLPELATYNPQIVQALNRLAESSARDSDFLRARAEKLCAQAAVFRAGGWCLLERAALAEAHEAETATLIRQLAQRYASGRGNLRFEMVEAALARIRAGEGRADLGQGIFCECTRRFVYIGRQPEGVWRRDDDGIWRQDFLEGAVTAPPEMIVRGYASGDAIALKNLGRKRLKKIFQEQALPPCLRPLWPILYDTKIKEIIWVPFLAQGPELMYHNSVTYLKVALSSTIAQRTVRSAPTSEEKER